MESEHHASFKDYAIQVYYHFGMSNGMCAFGELLITLTSMLIKRKEKQ